VRQLELSASETQDLVVAEMRQLHVPRDMSHRTADVAREEGVTPADRTKLECPFLAETEILHRQGGGEAGSRCVLEPGLGRDVRSLDALGHDYRTAPLLRIVYEDFVAAFEETVADVMRFLEVDPMPGFQVPAPTLDRQADALSEEWALRYCGEG
jgi:hypothetical protein